MRGRVTEKAGHRQELIGHGTEAKGNGRETTARLEGRGRSLLGGLEGKEATRMRQGVGPPVP